MKILYVCPFAHYAGHYTPFTNREAALLSKSGQDVYLLTFEGLLSQSSTTLVGNYSVLHRSKKFQALFFFLDHGRNWLITKWPLMFLEYALTVAKSISLAKKLNCRIIYIRDAEPFIFLPFLLSVFHKGLNIGITFVADPFNHFKYRGGSKSSIKNIGFFMLNAVINTRLWRPLYTLSLSRNNFVFVTENELIKEAYEKYQGGVFAKKLFCLPIFSSTGSFTGAISRKEARKRLGLPEDGVIFLSFGSAHVGKDVITIFEAMKHIPLAYLVHAGRTPFLPLLQTTYAKEIAEGRFIIRDGYVDPEGDKKYYFLSADAVVLSYVYNFQRISSILWDTCSFKDPVIASDAGELGSLVKEFNVGFLFTPQDPNSLREALLHFLNTSEDEKKKIMENCEKFNIAYSPESWVKKILKIYEEFPA